MQLPAELLGWERDGWVRASWLRNCQNLIVKRRFTRKKRIRNIEVVVLIVVKVYIYRYIISFVAGFIPFCFVFLMSVVVVCSIPGCLSEKHAIGRRKNSQENEFPSFLVQVSSKNHQDVPPDVFRKVPGRFG